MLLQLAGSVGKQFVRGMSAIDHRLESAGVLSPLEDPEQPEEATESDGGLTRDCRDVSFCWLQAAGWLAMSALSGTCCCVSLTWAVPISFTDTPYPHQAEGVMQMKAQLAKLELSNDEVWKKEEHRVAQPDWGPKNAPWPIRGAYLALCIVLDRIYDRRPIQRFWFLEVRLRCCCCCCCCCCDLLDSLLLCLSAVSAAAN